MNGSAFSKNLLDRQARANTNIEDDGRETRRTDILNRERVRLEVRRNFFTVRVVRYWNQLPEEVKEQRTINAFKNRLDVVSVTLRSETKKNLQKT